MMTINLLPFPALDRTQKAKLLKGQKALQRAYKQLGKFAPTIVFQVLAGGAVAGGISKEDFLAVAAQAWEQQKAISEMTNQP